MCVKLHTRDLQKAKIDTKLKLKKKKKTHHQKTFWWCTEETHAFSIVCKGYIDRQDSPAPETIISKIHVYVETITFQIHITEKHKK